MATKKQEQTQSMAPLVIPASIAAGAAAGWFGFPAAAVVYIGLLAAGWMEPPPLLSGKKDNTGMPTPANPGEEKKVRIWRFWQQLRVNLIVPSAGWLPGWPIQASWIVAIAVAAAAAHLPVNIGWMRLVNAVCAYLTVAVPFQSRRDTMSPDEPCPGTRIDALPKLAKTPAGIAALVGATVAAAAAALATLMFTTDAGMHLAPAAPSTFLVNPPAAPPLLSPATLAGAAALLVWVVVAGKPWQTAAIGHWRDVCDGRLAWRPRWQSLKHDPAPFLIDFDQVGSATVETFEAPGNLGAQGYWPLANKITPTVGAGGKLAVLEVPDEGTDGPMPGTRHPLKFQIVSWQAADMPSMTDPDLSTEEATLVAHANMVWVLETLGYGRPVPLKLERITTDGSPVAGWQTRWAWPGGPTLNEIRPLTGDLAAGFSCEVLVDHRADIIYIGALNDEQAIFDEDSELPTTLFHLAIEDDWNSTWAAVLKQDANPPTIQHATYQEQQLPGGTTLFRQAFLTRVGIDPTGFKGLEPKLATALQAAPFVSVCGWPDKGDRPGERHPQAFVVYWADGPVPNSPTNLKPSGAAQWVLSGLVNAAFDASRLKRPEVVTASALATRRSRKQIWEIQLRLHGGVTLGDVRKKAEKLRTHLGVKWLRVGEAEDGCTLYAGGNPNEVTLANVAADTIRLKGLDWEAAFQDARVVGSGGRLPELTDVGHLPNNEQVETLDFRLPSGIDRHDIQGGIDRLKVATGNDFIDVRDSDAGASAVRMLVCEVNPLPPMVAFDFDYVDTSDLLPFATGVEGEPLEFDVIESPHVLIAGTTGSGKSVLAQNFLYGALVNGWDLYVIDPVKVGTDFFFAEGQAKAFATDPFEAAGVMRAVYEEVARRKELNADHQVGSIAELPEDVRPPRIMVFIDEFTSLLGRSTVPKSDDPEMQAEIELLEAENEAKAEIGVYAGKFAREARSVGVTLALATQKLNAKMLDSVPSGSDLKTNLARTLLGSASTGDRASALRAFDAAPKLDGAVGKGRGLWEPLSVSAAVMMQVWYAPQQTLREELAERVPPLEPSEKLDVEGWTRRPGGGDAVDDLPSPTFDDSDDGEPVVVDVGEMELSWDDFDLDEPNGGATDGEVDDPDEPSPAPEQDAAPAVAEENAVPAPATPDTDPELDTVVFSAGGALNDTWRGVPVVELTADDLIDEALRWLDDHPHVTRVWWADPNEQRATDATGLLADLGLEAGSVDPDDLADVPPVADPPPSQSSEPEPEPESGRSSAPQPEPEEPDDRQPGSSGPFAPPPPPTPTDGPFG